MLVFLMSVPSLVHLWRREPLDKMLREMRPSRPEAEEEWLTNDLA